MPRAVQLRGMEMGFRPVCWFQDFTVHVIGFSGLTLGMSSSFRNPGLSGVPGPGGGHPLGISGICPLAVGMRTGMEMMIKSDVRFPSFQKTS